MEKLPRVKNEQGDDGETSTLSRRNFLLGASAVGVSAAIPQGVQANVESSPRPLSRSAPESRQSDIERLKEMVYDSYESLNEKALHFVDDLYNDLDVVTDRMSTLVAEDERYPSALHLIHEELSLTTIPEPIRSAVREMMLYVPYVESRFDNEAVSSVQAFGIVQLMPNAWDELSQDGEQKENLVDQVRVAGRLLEQTYRHLMNTHEDTINHITNLLYSGDAKKCGREFVGPLIINAYFSGMGTVEQVLAGFQEEYLHEEEKIKMAAHGVLQDEGGVYALFATAGELHGYSRNYGTESGKYVPKIIAAKQVMRAGLPHSRLAELIPNFEPSGYSQG